MKMKTIIIIAALLLMSFTLFAQQQIEMPVLDENYEDIDTIIHYEDYLLKVNIDTLFIINKAGVEEFERCWEGYKVLKENCIDLSHIDKILDEMHTEFNELDNEFIELESKFRKSLKENISNNTILIEENITIKLNLESAMEDLIIAKQKIKSERWKSMGSKLLWGSGGILVGVLAGGTLISIVR